MVDHLLTVAMSLPLGSTPEQISELIWAQIGLNVDPTLITCKDSTYAASAFVRVTEDILVDFLTRCFEGCVLDGQREAVRFEKKIHKWKGECNRLGIRRC